MRISKVAFKTWLESAANYEKQRKKGQFSLKTISLLANELDNPQNAFSSVHIAGSKGKGSVSAMIASILHHAGLKEGLYTSPHILDFYERVSTTEGFFDSSVYEESAGTLIPFIEEMSDRLNEAGFEQASWFELITLFAFLCFKNARVDYGVFETGLGGRFDATNILVPKLSVITPIELEHTEYLGTTIAQIAGEKAGIIKPNVPVCFSTQKEEARRVFETKTQQMNAPAYFIEDILPKTDFSFDKNGMNITVDFGDFTLKGQKSPLFARPICANMKLLGSIQAENAALAALSAKIAAPNITIEAIEHGLSHANLAGRFEISDITYDAKPLTVIFDGAHTVNSIRLTLDTYRRMFKNKNYHVLFACAYDKKVEDMARLFFGEDVGNKECIEGAEGIDYTKCIEGGEGIGYTKCIESGEDVGNKECIEGAEGIGYTKCIERREDVGNKECIEGTEGIDYTKCIESAEGIERRADENSGYFIQSPSYITLTKPGNDKPSDMARLTDAFVPLCKTHGIAYTVTEDFIPAADSALKRAAQERAILLVTGSFYLVSEVKKSLRQNKHVSPVLG